MLKTKQAEEIPAANTKNIHPNSMIRDLMKQARIHGPIYQIPLPDGRRQLILSSFALVDEVCNDALFDKALSPALQAAQALAGEGLFTSETSNPKWRKAHAILMPCFSMQAMQNYHPMMEDIAEQLVERWSRLNPEDEINVVNDMTRLTLDTVGLCGFGYRFQSFAREQMHPFIQSLTRVLSTGREVAAQSPLEKKLRILQRRRRQDDLDRMFSTVDHLIRERKAGGADGAQHKDLLNEMLNGVDPQTGTKLDDVNIRDQIMTFLIAGHETTSSLLSFALYFFLNHPRVLAKAYEEVDRVLGRDLKELPTYKQVHQLTYISQVLKETLRLCPPVGMVTRHSYGDQLLGGKYPITTDDLLTILVPMLHRDQSVWGEMAEIFDPDGHFNPEAEQNRPGNAFKPFGTGQRSCIGRQFALHEATLAVGMILQRFLLYSVRTYQLQIKEAGAIKPLDFFIKVKPRTDVDRATDFGSPGDEADTAVTEQPKPTSIPTGQTAQGTLQVLYGSNMGTAEALAHRIVEDGQSRGMTANVNTLDDAIDTLSVDAVSKNRAVVIIVPSYNGAPPDNATAFCHWLQSGLAPDALKGVQYTVFGCGNRDWADTYQAVPKLIDSDLEKYGATRLQPRGEGNAAGDFDGQFEDWSASLWNTLAQDQSLGGSSIAQPKPQQPLYEVEILRHPHPYPFVNSFGATQITVLANRELAEQNGTGRSVRHLQLALPNDMAYRTGGHLGVVPCNGDALVKRVAERFHFDEQTVIQLHKVDDRKQATPIDEPISVYDLLANYIELQDIATRAHIRRMAEYTSDETEKKRLELLSGTGEDSAAAYQQEVLDRRASAITLLEECPSCALPFNIYLELLTPLHPRYYSISSSPLVAPDECSITVGVVRGPARSGHGIFEGTCSNYLNQQKELNIIYSFVQDTKSPFHLPANAQTPIIMIGPGTGLAPFRGFLQERAMQQKAGKLIGASILFFGCQHPDKDFLYRDELEAFEKDGVTKLYTAFSRLDPQKKVYVQDKIYEHKDEVWQMLQNGAIVYICGDTSRMAPDVRKTFARIYQEKTGKSEQEANQWLDDMTARERYLVDIWGT